MVTSVPPPKLIQQHYSNTSRRSGNSIVKQHPFWIKCLVLQSSPGTCGRGLTVASLQWIAHDLDSP
jgi:hypothetical protein